MQSPHSQGKITAPKMSISEYVERREEWMNYPGRYYNGVYEIMVHGHWVDYAEFIKYFPQPFRENVTR